MSDIYRHKSIADLEKLFRRIRGDRHALAGLRDELGRRNTQRARHLLVAVEDAMHAERTAGGVREGPPPDYLPAHQAKSRTRLRGDLTSEPPPCPSCDAESDGECRNLAFAWKMGLARAHELGDPRVHVATAARAMRGTVNQWSKAPCLLDPGPRTPYRWP